MQDRGWEGRRSGGRKGKAGGKGGLGRGKIGGKRGDKSPAWSSQDLGSTVYVD